VTSLSCRDAVKDEVSTNLNCLCFEAGVSSTISDRDTDRIGVDLGSGRACCGLECTMITSSFLEKLCSWLNFLDASNCGSGSWSSDASAGTEEFTWISSKSSVRTNLDSTEGKYTTSSSLRKMISERLFIEWRFNWYTSDTRGVC